MLYIKHGQKRVMIRNGNVKIESRSTCFVISVCGSVLMLSIVVLVCLFVCFFAGVKDFVEGLIQISLFFLVM